MLRLFKTLLIYFNKAKQNTMLQMGFKTVHLFEKYLFPVLRQNILSIKNKETVQRKNM